VFGRFATARAAAGYRFPSGTRLRASIGNAYKEPNFDEQFETAFSRGNPGLEPERTTTYEAGVEQRLRGGRAVLAATWFDQRFTNMVQYGYRAGPDSTDYLNGPRATARGLEVELRVPALGRGVGLSASYTALRTRAERDAGVLFVRGARLVRRPSHQASATLGWRRAGAGSAAVTVNAVGTRTDVDFSRFPSPRVELPGYATVDLSAELPLHLRGVRGTTLAITGRAENVLDREFESVKNFANPGRRVLVGVRASRD